MRRPIFLDTMWGLLWYFDKAREHPGIHSRIEELRVESRQSEALKFVEFQDVIQSLKILLW